MLAALWSPMRALPVWVIPAIVGIVLPVQNQAYRSMSRRVNDLLPEAVALIL